MTYKTLETTPYKVVLKIVNDPVSNLHLLTDEENPDFEKLGEIWMSIYEELIALDPNNESNKILHIEREISALKAKYDFIQLSVCALEFDYDKELADMLREFGYTIRVDNENYYQDLERVRRESKAILNVIKRHQNNLPKQEEGEDFTKVNIDEVLAFYCTVLNGMDFDYNTVTYTKVMALQKQVSEKIKAIEENNRNINK
ncbi:hypothetical protein [Flavobacterium sp. UMI-01]|uniref:hypothetical protein n=1 Tax=Flavobacterium sp. UMI-01 TaxID=1441053 RepID=UPI001C7DDDEB|nr:hypothetical protein [Flavobacterium sp. UMI-01]GIZ08378.1 hypothetical protein FUMI01_11050 [Flavobacterium sp. UMI-01]